MKALILAAGFGTRLLPFTENIPKCLFPIAGRPLLDILIERLIQAGCTGISINTHHLHQKIESFIASQKYPIPVHTCHEPNILGTGGAVKNLASFWNDQPFMVVNSDIVTDIDLKEAYCFHLSHPYPATLVLHECPEFNTVSVDPDGFIIAFDKQRKEKASPGRIRQLTFTGIQTLDTHVLSWIPENVFSSSIDIYKKLISNGGKIKAFISKTSSWTDIGTPERYRKAVFEKMAPDAFKSAFADCKTAKITCTKLKGDGSDRAWYRLAAGDRSLVMADHGLRKHPAVSEIDSFVAIGRHLYDAGMPVPRIHLYDCFSGLVFLEDLGDENLQSFVRRAMTPEGILSSYQSVIHLLITLSQSGARNFDPSWTYQTPDYNRSLILEKECRYFVEAFLNGYLGQKICFEDFEAEFSSLADGALEFAVNGLMHRDFQSRNIMVKNNLFYFIDFQGGRIGPIQYDLASLLLDPYTTLPTSTQNRLLNYAMDRLSAFIQVNRDTFRTGYKYCAVTRTLQVLGAFGYLAKVKGKTFFEDYIPAAVRNLKQSFAALEKTEAPGLTAIVNSL